jgi:hypothetical protein
VLHPIVCSFPAKARKFPSISLVTAKSMPQMALRSRIALAYRQC